MTVQRILGVCLLPLCAALLLAGCQKGKSGATAKTGTAPGAPTPPQEEKPILPNPVPSGGGPAAHVQRGKQRQTNQNELRQLALFFRQMKTLQTDNRPVTKDELKAEVARDMPQLWKHIEDGTIVVNYNCDGSSNTVLAYEKEKDLNGNHLVVMGDGSTKLTPSAELQQILPR